MEIGWLESGYASFYGLYMGSQPFLLSLSFANDCHETKNTLRVPSLLFFSFLLTCSISFADALYSFLLYFFFFQITYGTSTLPR